MVVVHGESAYLRRCLESLGDTEAVVVQNHPAVDSAGPAGARPSVRVIHVPNRGFGAAVNQGLGRVSSRYALVLNDDVWLHDETLSRLVAYADRDPRLAVVGPRLVYPDGRVYPSMRGFPTPWRLATQYLGLSRIAPWTRLFNALYAGHLDPQRVNAVEFVVGACLLVRMEAVRRVGGLDEGFFMFAEEADWCLRFRAAGWKVVYVPHATATHVGGAATAVAWTAERTHREQERSHLRFLLKHQGPSAAERGRRIILWGYRLRRLVSFGGLRRRYGELAAWLAAGTVPELLDDESRREAPRASPDEP